MRATTNAQRTANTTIVLLFAVAFVLLVFTLAGCARGRAADGSTVVGFPTSATDAELDRAAASGADAGGLVGSVFGGPAGGTLGTRIGEAAGLIIAAIGAGVAVKKQRDARADARVAQAKSEGVDAGWDERHALQTHLDAAYDAGRADATPVANVASVPAARASPTS